MAYNDVLKGDPSLASKQLAADATTLAPTIKTEHPTGPAPSTVKCPKGKKRSAHTSLSTAKAPHAKDYRFKELFDLQLHVSHAAVSQTSRPQRQTSSYSPRGKGQDHRQRPPLIHFARVFNLAPKYEVLPLRVGALKAFEPRLKYSDHDALPTDEFLDVLRYLTPNARLEAQDVPVGGDGHAENGLNTGPA